MAANFPFYTQIISINDEIFLKSLLKHFQGPVLPTALFLFKTFT